MTDSSNAASVRAAVLGRPGRTVLVSVLYLVLMTQAVGLTSANVVNGVALGSLYGIIGVALVLVYRTSRFINFAASAIGAVPAIFALSLTTQYGANYALTFPIAALGGLLVGALTEKFILRRFSSAPRLIVTVISIGLAQTFAILGFFLPIWLGQHADQPPVVKTPWAHLAWRNGRGEPILSGNQIFALALVAVLTVGLSLFFSRTRMGMAVRAAAENSERAALLGVPVSKVQSVAWAVAGLLASLAIFAQAPLIGVPADSSLGFDTLLYGLAAAVVAGMERFSTALLVGGGIGVLVFASVAKTGSNDVASAVMLVVLLAALLLQRGTMSRAMDAGTATWQAVKSYRPIPHELRSLPEIRTSRAVIAGALLLLALCAPSLAGSTRLASLLILPIYGIVAVSLVVLTGWAGQISLGQFGLVGVGAAVSGGLVARHNIDFFAACGLGIAAGALAAVLIGLPAIRIQGLYLAVTTLAFGYAVQNYVLNTDFEVGRFLLPAGFTASIRRPFLYRRWNLEDDRTFYYVCLVALLLVMAAAWSFRKHRSGRVLIALRDNQRAASSYSINPVRTRLAAFAVSGGMAGLAGTLLSYAQHNVIPNSYQVQSGVFVFLAASVAGMTSVTIAVAGVCLLEAAVLFGPEVWGSLGPNFAAIVPLVLTGPLLVFSLYQSPGGLSGDLFAARDRVLRRVAGRRHLSVPSLVEDRLTTEERAVDIEAAARHEHEVTAARLDDLELTQPVREGSFQ